MRSLSDSHTRCDGRTLVIDRPHLLSLIEQTEYLDPRHPLKEWARAETVVDSDEFELDQWPDRSIDALIEVAATKDSDPYLRALAIALKLRNSGYPSPYPAGYTVRDVHAATSESAEEAADPLLQLLVANQAIVIAERLGGTAEQEFHVLGWKQGRRLTDTAPVYVAFYYSVLWQYWNSFPRAYASSHVLVPPAKDLLLHLAHLDGGVFERLTRLLLLRADLELLIAGLGTSDPKMSIQGCSVVRAQLNDLLELLDEDESSADNYTYTVRLDSLGEPCYDLAMVFLYLRQYQPGLQLLRLSLLLEGVDGAEDMVETVSMAISSLGLRDVSA